MPQSVGPISPFGGRGAGGGGGGLANFDPLRGEEEEMDMVTWKERRRGIGEV